MRASPDIAGLLLGILLVGPFGTGCVSIARSEIGSAPDPETARQLSNGAHLEEVITEFGVPLETVVQPDGLLLIYRERHYTFRRFGFEPGRVVSLVDVTGFLAAAIANLRLVFEWGRVAERRMVVLFDDQDRVAAVAYRDLAGNR